MAERATDLRDIERRVIANVVGEPEPGVPTPEQPSVLVAEDLAPSDTAVLDPAWCSAWSPSAVARPATPRSSPASSACPAWSARRGAMEIPAGSRVLLDGTTGLVEVDPDEAEAAAPGRPRPRGPGRPRLVDRSRGHRRRHPGQAARQRRRRLLRGDRRVRAGRRVSGCCAPSSASSTARTSRPWRSRPTSTPASSSRSARASTSWSAPSTPGRTSRSRSRPSRARRTPPSASAGCGSSFDNPGLLERQLDAIALAAERTGVETWVMAPMVATVAEAEDFAGKVRDRGLKAGRHGRGAERGAARRPDARGRRLPVDRHQRPQPVHDGRGPDGDRAGPPHRRLAAGGADADPDDGGGRAARRQARRRLRRGGRRPDAGHRADRHGHHVVVDGLGRGAPGRRPARHGASMETCKAAAAAAVAAPDPLAARAAVREVLEG